jgi:peroxiredoxin
MAGSIFKDRWNLIFVLIILIMGAEIIYLIKQNRDLRSAIDGQRRNVEMLAESDVVPPFSAKDINGNAVSITYAPEAPYTMLFWMSPDCSVCKENMAFWSRLHREYGGDNIRYIGFCAAETAEARAYVEEQGLVFPVICPGEPEIVDSYKGDILPQTVLISPEGAIVGVWPGSLEGVREDQILAVVQQVQSQDHQEGGEF